MTVATVPLFRPFALLTILTAPVGSELLLTRFTINLHIKIFQCVWRRKAITGVVFTAHTAQSGVHPVIETTDQGRVVFASRDDAQTASRASAQETADLHARFFRALGDPTRIRLLQLLIEAPSGECSVGELVAAIEAPQSRVSTHLGCLRWCGLVQTRREGKQVYYRVADPRVRELLSLGSAVLHDHAAGVASCGMIR
jgi:ArsR family transcriptional regulator, cadmium/lead-responsive transcriptional repressor